MKQKLIQQVITAIVRHGLTAAGGFMVANGYTDASTEQQIIGGLLALVGVVWSYFQKKTAHADLKAAQAN